MESEDKIRSVEIFAGTNWEAELLKSLLENAQIEAYLKDELIGNIFPFHASPGGNSPVKVIISSLDYEKALIVLEEFRKNK